MTYRVLLVKLLPAQYESDFLDGNLYLNSNSFFARTDDKDPVRFDPHDGADEAVPVKSFSILGPEGQWIDLPVIGPITKTSMRASMHNILCMYSITDRAGDDFDPRNMSFGDRAVVIANAKEFVRRVRDAATAVGRTLAQGPITYVDRLTYEGVLGPFRKYQVHSYQNEFRFVLADGDGQPFRLFVGNLRDIAYSADASDIPKIWKQMRQAAREDG